MPENVFCSNVVNGPGAVPTLQKDDFACEVFKAAVADWCDPKKKRRKGKFNDYYFKALEDKKAENVKNNKPIPAGCPEPSTRETPMGVLFGNNEVASFDQLATGGGPLANRAAALQQEIENRQLKPKKADAQRGGWGRKIKARLKGRRKIKRALFPDAILPDGTPLEIKGPGDVEHPKGQVKRYAAMSPTGTCVVVGCDSCGCEAACKSGRCKPKKKKKK